MYIVSLTYYISKAFSWLFLWFSFLSHCPPFQKTFTWQSFLWGIVLHLNHERIVYGCGQVDLEEEKNLETPYLIFINVIVT